MWKIWKSVARAELMTNSCALLPNRNFHVVFFDQIKFGPMIAQALAVKRQMMVIELSGHPTLGNPDWNRIKFCFWNPESGKFC